MKFQPFLWMTAVLTGQMVSIMTMEQAVCSVSVSLNDREYKVILKQITTPKTLLQHLDGVKTLLREENNLLLTQFKLAI